MWKPEKTKKIANMFPTRKTYFHIYNKSLWNILHISNSVMNNNEKTEFENI